MIQRFDDAPTTNNSDNAHPCPRLYLSENGNVYCPETNTQCSLKDALCACQIIDQDTIEVVVTPKTRLKLIDSLLQKLRITGYRKIALSFTSPAENFQVQRSL